MEDIGEYMDNNKLLLGKVDSLTEDICEIRNSINDDILYKLQSCWVGHEEKMFEDKLMEVLDEIKIILRQLDNLSDGLRNRR